MRGEWEQTFDPGTSPRTRGKPHPQARSQTPIGNIPAHAGKTLALAKPPGSRAEHPPARGENFHMLHIAGGFGGTSPRTRGKRQVLLQDTFSGRNIPAHAGKTIVHDTNVGRKSEHPRARGENCTRRPAWISPVIPSPGEHPRARGENRVARRRLGLWRGTSPRTRGKLPRSAAPPPGRRNIPAHAGKTVVLMPAVSPRREHPRARGENCSPVVDDTLTMGTSPRTRGKRRAMGSPGSRHRNIPAHAGKTRSRL